MKTSFKNTAFALIFLFTISSCGGGAEKAPEAIQTPTETTTPVKEEISNVITLEGNDQMQFNKQELYVRSGETITLTLKHTGTMEKNVMGHNFVLLKEGTDINAFAQKSLAAKDNDYIPKSESANILAHTKLLGGGESDVITFKVTAKGTYDFICSFPGHVAMMKGKLIVQ
jgi:azurin